MSTPTPTRRDVLLASLGMAIAGCTRNTASRTPGDAEADQPAGGPKGSAAPDARALAGAERLAQLPLTASERRQAIDSIEGQLALIQQRRAYLPPNDFPPASVFDPRLPGTPVPGRAHFEPVVAEWGDPGDDQEIAFAPVPALSHWIKTGALSSERLTELYLSRLRRLDPELECVITLTPEHARVQARRADAELARGRWRGPLHGIPWGAKDLLDTRGIATTWGATPYADRVPTSDASVVRRLDAAGAVMIAKLSLGALAYGDIWFDGKTKNPWNLDEGSSGSSAGSAAAVVSGGVGFALGTETLGSIVSPSTRCGATGLRPTFGRVSRAGAMAVAWSLDKIGPICRSAEGTMWVLQAIEGADPADPSTRGVPLSYHASPRPEPRLDRLTVGYDPDWFEYATESERAVLDALRGQGIALERVTLPDRPYAALLLNLYAEAAAAFEEITSTGLDDTLVWQDPEAWPNALRSAWFIPAPDFVQADRLRRRVMIDFARVFERVDALVSPSFAGPLLVATNFTGHPSLTLPVGFEPTPTRALFGGPADPDATDGPEVPACVTLWGRLYREDVLVHLGRALERALAERLGGVPGKRRRPPTR